MVLAKSAAVLNNVFPAADIIFFHPIVRNNLDPFSFSFKAVPFLICISPTALPT